MSVLLNSFRRRSDGEWGLGVVPSRLVGEVGAGELHINTDMRQVRGNTCFSVLHQTANKSRGRRGLFKEDLRSFL